MLLFAVLSMAGCRETDPYGPFQVRPVDTGSTSTRSWEAVWQRQPLAEGESGEGWEGPLVGDILQLGPWPPRTLAERQALDSAWSDFTGFEGTRAGVDGVAKVLDGTGALDVAADDLDAALGRFKVHFPGTALPDVDLGYTGFNYSTYPTDDLLLVGCEFFIGADHPAVMGLPTHIYPRYMQERMVPGHLVADALRGWLLVHFQQEHFPKGGRLADELLYWGKALFVARCISPETAPEAFMDWTAEEWHWARSHERQVWMELRKEEFLYTTRRMDMQRWVADAPFTKAGSVPQDSPDRLGWYMGLRWVEDFMRRHPDMTLEQLMRQDDVLPFLQAYRPGS